MNVKTPGKKPRERVTPHFGNVNRPTLQTGWKSVNKHGKVKYFGKDFKAGAHRHAGIEMNEQTQLDELSPKTKGEYAVKASSFINNKAHSMDPAEVKKWNRRQRGMARLRKEETQLDELVKVGAYTTKSGEVLTLHRNTNDPKHHVLVNKRGESVQGFHTTTDKVHKELISGKHALSGALMKEEVERLDEADGGAPHKKAAMAAKKDGDMKGYHRNMERYHDHKESVAGSNYGMYSPTAKHHAKQASKHRAAWKAITEAKDLPDSSKARMKIQNVERASAEGPADKPRTTKSAHSRHQSIMRSSMDESMKPDDVRTQKVIHKGEHVADVHTYRGRAGNLASYVSHPNDNSLAGQTGAKKKYGVDTFDTKRMILKKIKAHHNGMKEQTQVEEGFKVGDMVRITNPKATPGYEITGKNATHYTLKHRYKSTPITVSKERIHKVNSGKRLTEDNLNEISKDTLRKYITKADSDEKKQHQKANSTIGYDDISWRKVQNRQDGIDRATKKLAKEEVHIDEAIEMSAYHALTRGHNGKTFGAVLDAHGDKVHKMIKDIKAERDANMRKHGYKAGLLHDRVLGAYRSWKSNKSVNEDADAKNREIGTPSLTRKYKKATPGQCSSMDESFVAFMEARPVGNSEYDESEKAWNERKKDFDKNQKDGKYMPPKKKVMEAVRTADKAPVVVPAHYDAYGNAIPAKTVMRKKNKTIVNQDDNPSDGQ